MTSENRILTLYFGRAPSPADINVAQTENIPEHALRFLLFKLGFEYGYEYGDFTSEPQPISDVEIAIKLQAAKQNEGRNTKLYFINRDRTIKIKTDYDSFSFFSAQPSGWRGEGCFKNNFPLQFLCELLD